VADLFDDGWDEAPESEKAYWHAAIARNEAIIASPVATRDALPLFQAGWDARQTEVDQLNRELRRLSDHYQALMDDCDRKDAMIKQQREALAEIEDLQAGGVLDGSDAKWAIQRARSVSQARGLS
jgi:hypothetical protein